jgi:hypothetical protein
MAQQFLADRNGWLSFNASTPILYVTAEDDEFDTETLQAWCDEGFMVKYLPMGKDGKQYVKKLHSLGEGLSIGERYAVVGQHPPGQRRRGARSAMCSAVQCKAVDTAHGGAVECSAD